MADFLEEAAEHRTVLDTVLWERFKKLKRVFGKVFMQASGVSVSSKGTDRDSGKGGSPGSVLKLISDLLYYRGGYPSPSSPPRMDVLARQTAEAVRYLHLAGHLPEFREKLQRYGVDVVCSDKELFRVNLKPEWWHDREVLDLCGDLGLHIQPGMKPGEVMKALLDQCLSLQGTICQTSNLIKKDIYAQVAASTSDLRKPDFLSLVKVKTIANRAVKEPAVRRRLDKTVKQKVSSTRAAYSGLKVASKVKPLEDDAE